jgi:hypothetical protein
MPEGEMPIFLSLLVKDWKYLVIIAALLGGIGYIYHKGEAHVDAADAKVVAAQIVHNTEVDNVVKAKVAAAVKEYDELAPIPVPAVVPRILCYASGSSPVLQSPGAASGSDGAGSGIPVSTASTNAGFDPAPAISQTGTDADAEIEHLQKKVVLLQQLVQAYQAGGLVAK